MTKPHYINNDEFIAAILDYRHALGASSRYNMQLSAWTSGLTYWDGKDSENTKQKLDNAKANLFGFFLRLAEGVCRMPYMQGMMQSQSMDPDVVRQECALMCWEKEAKFKINYGKPFNFFTTCIVNNTKQLWRVERCQQTLIQKYTKHLRLSNPDFCN